MFDNGQTIMAKRPGEFHVWETQFLKKIDCCLAK